MTKVSKKALIVERSRDFFSRYGYELTSLELIAKECGITKPAIYYHFKNKSALYKAVICPDFTEVAEKIEENTQVGTPDERLRKYVTTFGSFLISHPSFSAIFAREIANGAITIPDTCIEQLSRTIKQLISILQEGEKKGIFTQESPFLIQMMIVTTLTSYNTTRPLRKRISNVIQNGSHEIEPNFENIIDSLAKKIIKGLLC